MKRKTQLTELICPNCGTITPIQRKMGKLRELYHLKWLYCYKCKKTLNHLELCDSDMLEKRLEFNPNRTEEEEKVFQLLKNRRR